MEESRAGFCTARNKATVQALDMFRRLGKAKWRFLIGIVINIELNRSVLELDEGDHRRQRGDKKYAVSYSV